MNYDMIRRFFLGKSQTVCLTGPTGVIVKSRYQKNLLACITIVTMLVILALTIGLASFFSTTFGMVLLAIPVLLCLTTRKLFIFRKNGSRLDIVKLIGAYKKSKEYSFDDIESIRVETCEKPSDVKNSNRTEMTHAVKKVSLQMKDNTVITLDETADVDYVELLVTSICQVSGIARSGMATGK